MIHLLTRKKAANSPRTIVSARKTVVPNIIYFNRVEFYENKLFGDRIFFRINGYLCFCDYRKAVIAATLPHVQMGGEFVDAEYDKEFAAAFQKEADVKLVGWRKSWNPQNQNLFWTCEIRDPSKRSIAESYSDIKPPAETLSVFKRLTSTKTAP